MDHADRWCMKCGAPCGYCDHEDCKKTEDEIQALRICQVYQGIEADKNKRTRR